MVLLSIRRNLGIMRKNGLKKFVFRPIKKQTKSSMKLLNNLTPVDSFQVDQLENVGEHYAFCREDRIFSMTVLKSVKDRKMNNQLHAHLRPILPC